MHGIAERLRRLLALDRGAVRWGVVGLAAAAAVAALLWFGLRPDERGAEEASMSPAGADVLPPLDEYGDQPAVPDRFDTITRDVIPPDEP
jgi:hypothetical protein